MSQASGGTSHILAALELIVLMMVMIGPERNLGPEKARGLCF